MSAVWSPSLLWTDPWVGGLGDVGDLLEGAQEGPRGGDSLGEPGGVAAQDDQAAAHRAQRVLAEEQRVGVVVQPGEPEQVTLLGGAGRVVGECVGELVELAEPVAERGGEVAERPGSLLGVPHRAADRTGEGPDLVAQRGDRVAQERARLAKRRTELPGGRDQVARGRAEHLGELLAARQCRAGSAQGAGQLRERRPDRVLLIGEGAQYAVGGLDELREAGVAAAELLRDQPQAGDRPRDVLAPHRPRTADPSQVARPRLQTPPGP